MDIYVGNLPYDCDANTVRDVFAAHGSVVKVHLVNDRETGRPKGFGFVQMSNDDEARTAIQALDGREIAGRPVRVNEARPREQQRDSRPPQRDRGGERGGFQRRRY